MQPPILRWTITAVASVALVGAMVPTIAEAQRDPRFDPTCWPEEQCKKAAKKDFPVEFRPDSACATPGTTWGRCFPKKPIPIQFKIPGLAAQEVSDLGQYIQAMYKFAVFIGAGLAVLIIMVAGLIVLTSAGTDRIATAKGWIANALTGLLLIVLSYLILNTVNPDLTRLTLPGIMMIRPSVLSGQTCDEVAVSVKEVGGTPRFSKQRGGENGRYDIEKSTGFKCEDNVLYPEPLYTQVPTCSPTWCPKDKVCVPKSTSEQECATGILGGSIDYKEKTWVDEAQLRVVCSNQTRLVKIDAVTPQGDKDEAGKQVFTFAPSQLQLADAQSACGGRQNQRGFLMWIQVNDEEGLFGGIDDWFAVGRSSGCNGSSIPLQGNKPIEDFDPNQVGDAELWPMTSITSQVGTGGNTRANLQPCRLNIDRTKFPSRG